MLQVLLLLLLLLLSLGGSSPYTSTKKANKNTLYVNETIHRNTVQTIQNTVHTSIYIFAKIPTHTQSHNHTLQYDLKQPQYTIHPNESVTIQSNTLSIGSPYCTRYLHCPFLFL